MRLPLDEVPVHVHRFAARAPCDSKGSQCQCGVHTAEAASALRSRKTERAAKEKPTPISQFFLAPAAPGTPTRRHALGRLPTPPPLPENLLLRLHRKLPSAPLASSQEVRNPKIRQQLGAQPTPRFRVMIEAMIEALIDPLHALHFLLPTGDSRSGRRSFDSKHLPSPARRGSRSRPPLRRPRPLRFERLPVPVWNPYSRGRLSPAKSEDRKGAHLAAVLLSHPPQHLLAKRPQLGPRARPPHVAML